MRSVRHTRAQPICNLRSTVHRHHARANRRRCRSMARCKSGPKTCWARWPFLRRWRRWATPRQVGAGLLIKGWRLYWPVLYTFTPNCSHSVPQPISQTGRDGRRALWPASASAWHGAGTRLPSCRSGTDGTRSLPRKTTPLTTLGTTSYTRWVNKDREVGCRCPLPAPSSAGQPHPPACHPAGLCIWGRRRRSGTSLPADSGRGADPPVPGILERLICGCGCIGIRG